MPTFRDHGEMQLAWKMFDVLDTSFRFTYWFLILNIFKFREQSHTSGTDKVCV